MKDNKIEVKVDIIVENEDTVDVLCYMQNDMGNVSNFHATYEYDISGIIMSMSSFTVENYDNLSKDAMHDLVHYMHILKNLHFYKVRYKNIISQEVVDAITTATSDEELNLHIRQNQVIASRHLELNDLDDLLDYLFPHDSTNSDTGNYKCISCQEISFPDMREYICSIF